MGLLFRASLPCLLFVGGVFAQQTDDEALSTATTFGTTVVIPGGLRGSVYFIPENTMVLPDFDHDPLERVGEIWTNDLNIPPRHWRSGFPGLTKRFEWFAIDYSGRFWIEQPGRYTFALLSDDGSRLFLDDTPVIDNDCQHPPDVRVAAVRLEGGVHRIRVSYFQGPRDCLSLMLAVAGPDHEWKAFDVREFKPPSNPDEWNFPTAGSMVVVPTTPEEAATTVNSLSKRLWKADFNGKSPKSKAGSGCAAQPIRICGN
jgi:PA14 domain